MNILSEAMKEILYPSHINRIPDHLCYYKQYKASALLHLYLYSFPFVFKRRESHISQVINTSFRRLIMGFSLSLHLLLADRLNKTMSVGAIMRARHSAASSLVREFLHSATILVGQSRMTYNFHQLLHLVDNYFDFGPLYEISAFPHESNLGALRSMIYGTNVHIADKEICNKFAMYQCLAGKLSSCEISVAKLTGKASSKSSLSDASSQALDSYLSNIEGADQMTIKVFKRGYLANGYLLHVSTLTSHETPRCDSFYLLSSGNVGEILYLLEVLDVERKIFLAVVNVVGSKETQFPWVNDYDKLAVTVDHPVFFVKKPTLGQHIEVLPIEELKEPVMVTRNTSSATQFMSTTFFMSKN